MTLDDDCLLTDPPLEDDGPEAAPGIPTEHAPTRRGRSFQPRAHRHIQPGSSIFKIWLRSQGLPPPPRRPRKEGGGASKSHAHPGPGGQTKGSEGMMPLGEETGFDTGHEPSSSLGGSDVPIAFPHMTHKNEGRQMQLGTGGGSSSGGSVCHPAPPPPPMPPVPPPRNIKHDDPFLPPTPGHPSFSSGSRSSAGTRRHPLPLGANREAPHQPSTLLSSSAPSASCAYRPPDPTSTIPAPSPRRAVPKPPPGPPPPTAASRAPSGPPPGVPPFFHHGRATSPNDPHPFSMEAFHTLPPPPQLPPPGPPDLQWTPTAEGPGMPPFPALPLPPPFSCMGGPFGAPPLPLPPVPLPPPLHSNYAVPTSPTGGRAAEGAPGGASPSPQLGLPEWYHTNVYR
uniref:Uncharacterized protein n=1 Tax=Chromera velia CCMP2878 TaxID=1169474 RepID=A0A0G4FL49_9ALVE|eukprot:Cvel_17548.t1-p1 / transcript=Cvel_17548.t1 / gene=Cvel_17548 / organism=Chromera_velia_CCMP2878 / gene_product=hypothetical protein / transcript_product=hypothetical protein / location=Cvel_scaffold1408:46162-47346(+) / protein_length=395 / sequence_SO=supercontig / SO=protein_coding / is_pseudo=false